MTTVAETNWSRLRWVGVVTLIFAVQFAFIFGFGARRVGTPRRPFPAPEVFLAAEQPFPLAEFYDPTIFSLPHRHGFSGLAAALTPRPQFTATGWDEPFRWLPLRAENLGQSFRQLLADNLAQPLPFAEKISSAPTALQLPVAAAPAASQLHIEGALAQRALLAAAEIPTQRAAAPLPDTIVQAVVDAGGRVVTATILSPGGSADASALALVRQLRFEPLPGGNNTRLTRPLEGLTWGKLIFNWRTVAPVEAENSPTP